MKPGTENVVFEEKNSGVSAKLTVSIVENPVLGTSIEIKNEYEDEVKNEIGTRWKSGV